MRRAAEEPSHSFHTMIVKEMFRSAGKLISELLLSRLQASGSPPAGLQQDLWPFIFVAVVSNHQTYLQVECLLISYRGSQGSPIKSDSGFSPLFAIRDDAVS